MCSSHFFLGSSFSRRQGRGVLQSGWKEKQEKKVGGGGWARTISEVVDDVEIMLAETETGES